LVIHSRLALTPGRIDDPKELARACHSSRLECHPKIAEVWREVGAQLKCPSKALNGLGIAWPSDSLERLP